MHSPFPAKTGALLAVLVSAGCATAPNYASPDVVAAEEARLMSPYEGNRAVVSNVLTIEISPNFNHEIARPAVSPEIHKFSQTVEDGDDVYRWSSNGGIQSPLKFQIGQVQFAALRSATLRVRSSGQLALDVTAAGRVTESQPGQKLQDWSELAVQNGLFQRR